MGSVKLKNDIESFLKPAKLLRTIASLSLLTIAIPSYATGYIPFVTEFNLLVDDFMNPEPRVSSVIGSYWEKADTTRNNPLKNGQTKEGKPIYLCATRLIEDNLNNTRLGFTDSLNGPCYLFYSKQSIIDTVVESKDLYLYSLPEQSKYISSYQFNWSKALPKRKSGHESLAFFSAENYSDLVGLCQVSDNGNQYPGFILTTGIPFEQLAKTIAKGKSICHYKKSISSNVIYKATSSKILYWGKQKRAVD